MKRFYKLASLTESPDGFLLLLDGKPVKTPAGHELKATNAEIAAVLLQEWSTQEKDVVPSSMPFTQILSTKFDRVIPQREGIGKAILKYLDTDLLCYRAQTPPELARQQAEIWDPWLKWFAKKFGVSLQITNGLNALKQDPAAHKAVARFVHALSDDAFNILQWVTSMSGSLVLGLAFAEKVISGEEIFKAMRVEENYKANLYNEEHYGPEILQSRRDEGIRHDLAAAADFLNLLT